MTTMPAAARLTSGQATSIDHARDALAGPPAYEAADMTARIGALEWHLGELLALVGELAPEASGTDQAPGRSTTNLPAIAPRAAMQRRRPRRPDLRGRRHARWHTYVQASASGPPPSR